MTPSEVKRLKDLDLEEVDLNYEINDLTIRKLEKMNLQEIINIYQYLKQYFKGRD